MICHCFKGGTGTASRIDSGEDGGFTVGVLACARELHRPAVLRGLAGSRPAGPLTSDDREEQVCAGAGAGLVGGIRLKELGVSDVDRALAAAAATRSRSTVAIAHLALARAITRAQAKNLVARNVSALTETPQTGKAGRPSRSMTLAQALALVAAAKEAGPRMHAYLMVEARALRWEHVDFGDPGDGSPRPAGIAMWRSVRAQGDTKTSKSRRTLALPQLAADALAGLHNQLEPEPGDLVFSTWSGRALDASHVRCQFRAVCMAAGLGPGWTP